MNGQRLYFSDQNLNAEQPLVEGTNIHFQTSFKSFLNDFNKDNKREYHQQIGFNIEHEKYYVSVSLVDLKSFDEMLYEKFTTNPLDMIGVMESAVKDYVKQKREEFSNLKLDLRWQVIIKSNQNSRRLRQVTSNLVSKIFTVNGIIISCTKPYIKATKLKLKCKNCQTNKFIQLLPGQYPYIPTFCPGIGNTSSKCPPDPFVAMPDSEVIDIQNMKIQQNPEEIPTGEIARTYSLVADRYNVSKCVPGDRVKITGIMIVHEMGMENLSKGSIYVTGIQKLKERQLAQYSQQDIDLFKKMSKDPNIYEKIARSIAPGIYGNEEIKKAIACMLFGGSRKHLPDNTILRGDINILLMGDPSTAKSQFLKFVEQTASIAVYTSGKGSSAAGLTASITKDNTTGEFQIEGGALVLADGGIVCIDEFDKMKPGDRVAIHEAMEQQTISVAKAGITTRLNSRTSVLAAANPIFGRYDDLKQISEQIQLQTTILSRFDCIFIVRDINTPESNERLATHILDLHQGKIIKSQSDIPFDILKKFINYARHHMSPRLSSSAAEKLQNIYVADRQKAKEQKKLTKNTIPITVRQLQAIIRLSQSLAKMQFKKEVSSEDVDQAHYLFEISTMKTIEGKQFGAIIPENEVEMVQKVEESIKKRICIGNQVPLQKLVEDLESKYSSNLICYAISNLVKNGELKEAKGKKYLIRDQ